MYVKADHTNERAERVEAYRAAVQRGEELPYGRYADHDRLYRLRRTFCRLAVDAGLMDIEDFELRS